MTVFFDYILGELRLKDTSGGGSAGSLEAIQIDQSGGTSDTYGVLSGTINGSNTLFTVSKSEYITGTLRVFLNGQLQTQGSAEDWVETTPASGTFTFNTAPQTGDEITVAYNYPATGVIDSLVVNNLSVNSTASINVGYFNGIYASTISTGNLTTNNLAVTSLASINHIRANSLIASTATLGLTHISTIDWNLTSGATVTQEGQMNWDANQQTAVIGMAGGNVDLALGMETLFPRRVRNSTGSTMAKGTVVYINGVSGNTPTVERAIATSDMSSAFTLGMTAEDIANTSTGWVTTFGELTGLDLSGYTGGDTLYLSGATAGAFTNVPQSAPNHYVRVGTVVKATTDGALVVNVINGYEINELHNVAITSLASGQIIQSGASNLWYNRSLASAIADLNVLASLGSLAVLNELSYSSLISKPSLGSLAEQNTVDYVTQITNLPSLGSLSVLNELSHNSTTSIQGGTAGEYYHLTVAELTNLNNQSGTNTGNITISDTTSVNLTLGGVNGQLLSADVLPAGVDHNSLAGLTTGDPHTQYALLGGRSGNQALHGANTVNGLLILRGSSANGNTATSTAIRMGVGNGGGLTAWDMKQNGSIAQTANVTSGNGYSLGQTITGTSGDSIGAFFDINDTAGGIKTIYGHRAKLTYSGATIIQGMQSTSNQMIVNGGGIVNFAEVLTSNLDVSGNSAIGQARLIRLFAPNVASTASIGTLIGLDIPALTQGTTNWSIYSDGGDMYHAGNIGIGTAPTAFRALNLSDTKNSTLAYMGFFEGATEKWVIGTQSGEFGIYDSAGGAFRITIEPSGEVGIGNTNPTQRLDVNGRIRMATWTADGDTVAYRDTATNCIALVTSDARLKKDLEVIPNALDKVKSISGYTYRRIDEDSNAKKKYGVIAQEILEVAPELTFEFTNEDDPTTYYSVHYDKLPALLIEAIKEQQKTIEDLKARLEVLENK